MSRLRVLICLLVLTGLLGATATSAGAAMSDPTAVARQVGSEDVFVRGTDNHLWHAWFINGWHGWEDLGGSIVGNPQAISVGPNNMDVFARNANGYLVHRWWSPDSGWSSWQQIGTWQLADDPEPVSWGQGRIDVYARGLDSALIHAYTSTGTWSNFESLGGGIYGKPDAISYAVGHNDIFVRGTDNTIWHRYYSNGWGPWAQLGTYQSTLEPVAVSYGYGRIDAFITGLDNALDHIWTGNGAWVNQWESLGGFVGDHPAVQSYRNGQMDVFTRGGADKYLWHRWVDNSGWWPWTRIGGYQFEGSPEPVSWGVDHQDVFVRGLDGAVDHVFMQSNGVWYDWQGLGVPTNSATWPAELTRPINIGSLVSSFNNAPSDLAARSLLYGLSAADRASFDSALRAQLNDGNLMRDVSTGEYWYYHSSARVYLGTAANVSAAGYNPATARRFTSSALGGITVATQIESFPNTLTTGPIETADGSDGDAVAAGYAGRGCRPTHDRVDWKHNAGHMDMYTRFCWNAAKKKAVWDANSPVASQSLEMDADMSTIWEVSGHSVALANNKIYYPIAWNGSNNGAIHMETWYSLTDCPILHVPIACTTDNWRYVTIGYSDGHATAYFERR